MLLVYFIIGARRSQLSSSTIGSGQTGHQLNSRTVPTFFSWPSTLPSMMARILMAISEVEAPSFEKI
ncbi:hypothetical protein R1sor_009138 [Riccia sorocarpa]|uniref:Uncharacterized protein n=1 Tax=Riccia sorocarpa TaxID=122646 RepID=A0ABD3H7Q3_9MARC